LMDNIPTRSVWLDSILRKAGRGTFPKTSPMNSADSRPNRCGLLNRVPHNEDGNEEN
jgi:hypothetical protein